MKHLAFTLAITRTAAGYPERFDVVEAATGETVYSGTDLVRAAAELSQRNLASLPVTKRTNERKRRMA